MRANSSPNFRSALLATFLTLLVSASPVQAMELRSASLEPGAQVPETHVYDGFGCSGDNLSPALEWSRVPEGTESLALTVYDPDAPTGSGWWHWLVYDIPAAERELPLWAGASSRLNLLPAGTKQGRNDYGEHAYGGPCPPPGDEPHRYVFRIFALDVKSLPISEDVPAAQIGYQVRAHALDSGKFVFYYSR
jgi:Raf kinase inhibitor-like YbhB/YbcL family protein